MLAPHTPSLSSDTAIPAADQPEGLATAQSAAVQALGEQVVASLRQVFDPEIPVNIYDLGLIYRIDIAPRDGGFYDVDIDMTLTTPNCPVAETMPQMVQDAVKSVAQVDGVTVNLVWEPMWDRHMMTDEARLQLNMF